MEKYEEKLNRSIKNLNKSIKDLQVIKQEIKNSISDKRLAYKIYQYMDVAENVWQYKRRFWRNN